MRIDRMANRFDDSSEGEGVAGSSQLLEFGSTKKQRRPVPKKAAANIPSSSRGLRAANRMVLKPLESARNELTTKKTEVDGKPDKVVPDGAGVQKGKQRRLGTVASASSGATITMMKTTVTKRIDCSKKSKIPEKPKAQQQRVRAARKAPSRVTYYSSSENESTLSDDHMSDFIVSDGHNSDNASSDSEASSLTLNFKQPEASRKLLFPPLPSSQSKGSTDTLLLPSFNKLTLNDPPPSSKSPERTRKAPRSSTPPPHSHSPPPTNPLFTNPPILTSPKKPHTRIPASPHRQSSDAFWSQAVINEWNEEYSPRRKLQPPMFAPPKKPSPSKSRQEEAQAKQLVQAEKERKKDFNRRKDELAKAFLAEVDERVTHGRVQALTASAGGVKIVWSKSLITTAGRAKWKRELVRGAGAAEPVYRHNATIELAEKVIDDEDRLINVVAHEFCHLANYMISGIKDSPHGKEFKAWASMVTQTFAHRGVQVTTKHSYAIEYKYGWKCVLCRAEFKRHSKSIDPTRHACGRCKGKLEQVKPVPRKNNNGDHTPRAPSQYQLFVKEQYRRVRDDNPQSPRKDIMGLVAAKYKAQQQQKQAGGVGETMTLGRESPQEMLILGRESPEHWAQRPVSSGSAGSSGSSDLDEDRVTRRLDFVDLTNDD